MENYGENTKINYPRTLKVNIRENVEGSQIWRNNLQGGDILVVFFPHMCDLSVNPSPRAVKDAKYNSKRNLVFLTRKTRKRKAWRLKNLQGRPWKGDRYTTRLTVKTQPRAVHVQNKPREGEQNPQELNHDINHLYSLEFCLLKQTKITLNIH